MGATSQMQDQKKKLLINRNFAFLWSGQAISNLGDMVFDTTLVLWVATRIAVNQPWAPLAVSGVMLATALPILLIGPLAGVFVDRWEKRRTMLRMDAIRALLIALLLFIALPLPVHLPIFAQLGVVYTVVALASTCSQFFSPARTTLISDVVDEADLARASGLGQISQNLAIIIGPPLAAPLLFVVGVQWALIINALSFVASFLAILAIRSAQNIPETELQSLRAHSFWKELGAGLHFFGHSRILMTLLINIVIVTLGTGALNALDVFFVTQNLHTDPNLYGIIGMGFGAGSILGALIANFFIQRLGITRVFWGGLVTGGLLILLYSRMNSFVPALLIFGLAGLPIAALNIAVLPLLLHATPRNLLGRVMSVINPVQTLASLISTGLAGILASNLLLGFHATLLGLTLGTNDTIFSAAALLIILGGIYALFSLRNLNLAEQAEKHKKMQGAAPA